MPAAVLQRRRNGPEGIGSIEKQPISSATVAVSAPVRGCTLIVAACGGTTSPRTKYSATSSSMLQLAEVEVTIPIDAGPARVLVKSTVSADQPEGRCPRY